jgi:MinD-like ATPase involved in chromosome partitioning or flagellar assembly
VGRRELAATPSVASLAEVRRFLATAESSGLEVLPGLRDLTGPGLTAAEAAWVVDLLERLFPTVVVDGPPGWTQPVPAVLLARADTVVLTARAQPPTARGWRGLTRPTAPEPTRLTEAGAAQDALTALAAARADLPACTVVVHVETTPLAGRPAPRWPAARTSGADVPALVEAVHSAVTIPFDPALAGGAPLDWAELRPRTREAFALLAETVDEAPLGPIEPVRAGRRARCPRPARGRASIRPTTRRCHGYPRTSRRGHESRRPAWVAVAFPDCRGYELAVGYEADPSWSPAVPPWGGP